MKFQIELIGYFIIIIEHQKILSVNLTTTCKRIILFIIHDAIIPKGIEYATQGGRKSL